MSFRNFTFLRVPFSPLRSISRCGAHRSPSARSRKSSRSLVGPVPSRRGRFSRRSQGRRTRGKSKGEETRRLLRAYSARAREKRKCNAAKKSKRREKKAGKREEKNKEKVKQTRGKQKRTKARARDGGGLKNDIHRKTK